MSKIEFEEYEQTTHTLDSEQSQTPPRLDVPPSSHQSDGDNHEDNVDHVDDEKTISIANADHSIVAVEEVGIAIEQDFAQVVHVIPSDKKKFPWLLKNLPGLIIKGEVLIFVSNKASVEDIQLKLVKKGFKVGALHGDKNRASRMEILQKFKSGICHVLIATDVAVRGLEIQSIKSVVNFDIADDMDAHLHRLGYSDKDGTVYTLITHHQSLFASELVDSFNAAGQNVSVELMELAMQELHDDEEPEPQPEGRKIVSKKVDMSQHFMTDEMLKVDTSQYFMTNELFDSREDLMRWCRDAAFPVGVVLATLKSESTTPKRRGRVQFGCERGGFYKRKQNCNNISDKTPRKNRGSRKCGCPFVLNGRPLPDGRWKLSVECGVHNHEISPSGRLQPDEVKLAEQMSAAGIAPKHILSTLKLKNENNYSTRKTIYNIRNRFRHRELCRRTVMKHTLKMVNEHCYLHFAESCSQRNVVTQIFWCNPDSIKLFKVFPDVLIVDCTYKTNKYKMPLFEMVGVASTGHAFNVGFVFMENENESSYVWAFERLKTVIGSEWTPKVVVTDKENILINAIGKVFPNASRLLCRWHVNKDITANCKKDFEEQKDWLTFIQEWEDLIDVQSEERFATKLMEFETVWSSQPSSISYIRTNWLPHKEYLVIAWTKQVMHLGCTATQRGESAHRTFDEYMKSSSCSYPEVWKSMHTMVKLQLFDIDSAFQQSMLLPKFAHMQDPVYAEIRGYVSLYALDIMENEKKRGLSFPGFDHASCGCLKRMTHGLPCAHEILEYSQLNKPIPLSCIHQHWKQLSHTLPESLSTGLDFSRDIAEHLAKKWATSTEEKKRGIKRKIDELLNAWELHQWPHAEHGMEANMED